MKNILSFLVFISLVGTSSLFSQNVGIGTTSPTNTLHIIPLPGSFDPVRFEGITQYTNEDSVLVVNPSTGVIKYMPMADVLSNIPPNILDSLILNSVLNNTDTIYNNQSVKDSILSIMLGNSDSVFSTQTFKDSVLGVILSNIDTVFTLTRDSLLTDSTFINTMRDSINTDDQNIDSLTITGTILTTYIEDGASASTNLQPLVDSLIYDKYDSIYAFMSDSLSKDSSWISSLDSMLSIYGDTIYFNDSSYVLVRDSVLGDTLFIDSLYTLISDSLLNDSLWIDSLGNLLNDNDWNINANGTGLEAAAANDNFASGAYAIAAGQTDTASGLNSVISGGRQNKAIGSYSSVTGGYQNLAQGSYSVVGGYRDTTLGGYSGVLSGRENTISGGSYSVISGGYRNKLLSSSYARMSGSTNILESSSSWSFIHGYQDTITNTSQIATVFGWQNKIDGSTHSAILNGRYNKIYGTGTSVITGGQSNKMDVTTNPGVYNSYSAILAGTNNFIEGDNVRGGVLGSVSNTISGGAYDTISGSHHSGIIAGHGNRVSGSFRSATIGGRNNKIDSVDRSVIVGGLNNIIQDLSQSAQIIGGEENNIMSSSNKSVILGGDSNIIEGRNAIVLGGRNLSGSSFGEITGGQYNTSYVPANRNSWNTGDKLFVLGNGTSISARSNAFVVNKDGTVEFNEAYTLPNVDGTASQILVTDGSGTVSWQNAGGAGTDDQNIDSLRLTGTVLTTYIENGASANIDLQPIVDSAVANATGADNDWDINANTTGLEAAAAGDNFASGAYAIAAGQTDTASGNFSVVTGGRLNKATGVESTVGGGNDNIASGLNSVISGGIQNRSSTSYSAVSGGFGNNSSGNYSVVAGGDVNTASAYSATVGGGENNTASGGYATVSGGFSLVASGDYAAVSGGDGNFASGQVSTISGGQENQATGDYSTVSGGYQNRAPSYGEWIGGVYSTTYTANSATAWNANDRLFVVGNGTSMVNRSNALTVLKNGNTGIGGRQSSYVPTNKLHLTDTAGGDPLRIEDLKYGGTTDSLLVTDGDGVVKLASASSLNTKNFVSTAVGYVVANGVDVVLADLSASAFTVTLPDPTTNAGRVVKVKRVDNGTSTFGLSFASPSGTIDGVASPAGPFTVGYQGYEFMSDGTNWWILTRY